MTEEQLDKEVTQANISLPELRDRNHQNIFGRESAINQYLQSMPISKVQSKIDVNRYATIDESRNEYQSSSFLAHSENPLKSALDQYGFNESLIKGKMPLNERIKILKQVDDNQMTNKKIFKMIESQIIETKQSRTAAYQNSQTSQLQKNISLTSNELDIQRKRCLTQFKVGAKLNEASPLPESAFPINKQLIDFKPNQKLLEFEKFHSSVDIALNQASIPEFSSKLNDRIDRYNADYRGKLSSMETVLSKYMDEAKHEFLIKPSPYHTRDEIEKYIEQGKQGNKKGKKIYVNKNLSDFDVIAVNKYTHFIDHAGNYLTRTGLKIDDFSLDEPKVEGEEEKKRKKKPQSERRYLMGIRKNKTKELPKLVNMKNKVEETPDVIYEKKILAPEKQSIFQRQKKDYRKDISPFKSATIDRQSYYFKYSETDKQLEPEPKIAERDKISLNSQDSTSSQIQPRLARNKEVPGSIWNTIQLKNYQASFDYDKAQNQDEQALMEFIKECDKGLQLPFSLLCCIKKQESGKPIFHLESKLTEAASQGVGEAIKTLKERIKAVSLNHLGLSDQGVYNIVDKALSNPHLLELHLFQCQVGPITTQRIQKYIEDVQKNQNDPEIPKLKTLSIIDCKIFPKDFFYLIKSMTSIEPQSMTDTNYGTQFPVVQDYFKVEEISLSRLKLQQHEHLLPLLRSSEYLRKVDISYNQFKKSSLASIISYFSFGNLKFINLSFNHLHINCLEYLKELMKYSWSLTDLDLSFIGKFKPIDYLGLINTLKISNTMQALHLSGAELNEETTQEIRQILGITQKEVRRRADELKDPKSVQSPTSKNKVRFDIQVNERLVYSRILGHPEIQRSSLWKEDENCWICQNYSYCYFLWMEKDKTKVPLIQRSYETELFKMMRVNEFCSSLGCYVENLNNSWYQLIQEKAQYKPFIVTDLIPKKQKQQNSSSDLWWIYADFIMPEVNQQILLDFEVINFQVPNRDYQIKTQMQSYDLQPLAFDIYSLKNDTKSQKAEQVTIQTFYQNFAVVRYEEILKQRKKFHNEGKPKEMFKVFSLPSENRAPQMAYEKDYKSSTISQAVEINHVQQKLQVILQQNYEILCDIYIYLVIDSPFYPFMNVTQFEDFIERYQLYSYDISVPGSENILKNAYAGVLTKTYLKKGDQDFYFKKILQTAYDQKLLNRFQFIDLLIRISIGVKNPPQQAEAFNQTIKKLIQQWPYPTLHEERQKILFTFSNDYTINKNMAHIFYKINPKGQLYLHECIKFFMNLFKEAVCEKQIKKSFILSKRLIEDEVEDQEKYIKLDFREFQEFVLRMASNVINEGWPLFYSIDIFINKIKSALNTTTYSQYLKLIYQWNQFRKFPNGKPNLDQMTQFAYLCDNPQNKFKIIHIAGTNGKGTVSLKTAKSLEFMGFKTGLFTSPHITCFRERIQVNGVKISEQEVCKYMNRILDITKQENLILTYFEIVTMMAWIKFAEEKVDYAIIECGIGGRLDSTNIVDKPVCSVITSVGFDHMEILGDTLEKIGGEKAGIFRENVPVVLGQSVTQESVMKEIELKKCKVYQSKSPDFRESNNEIVKNILKAIGVEENQDAIQKALLCEQPCRMEKVSDLQLQKAFNIDNPPLVYLDVCHNQQAVSAVISEIEKRHTDRKVSIVSGFSKNKDIVGMIQNLVSKDYISRIYGITCDHPRLANSSELFQKFKQLEESLKKEEFFKIQNLINKGNIRDTLEYAVKQAALENEIVLVCGSFFVMTDARKSLCFNDELDPEDVY